MSFSFWEYDFYSKDAMLIVGAGITGVSAAISIKEKNPDQEVILCDTHYPPLGASTKNAGFVCFGSLGELLADIHTMSAEECVRLIRMRWEGASILKNRLATHQIYPDMCGGYELLDQPVSATELDLVNSLMHQAIGISNYFKVVPQQQFKSFHSEMVFIEHEGRLDPQLMMDSLYKTANHYGVKFITGRRVSQVDSRKKVVTFDDTSVLKFNKIAICTNGFASQFITHREVWPARNTVLVTSPVADLKWDGVYHYDSGYYYFRRIGNRILLGGARNMDPETEKTSSFDINPKIRQHLISFLYEKILEGKQQPVIEYWWSGILGVGPDKFPILEEYDNDCYAAVRLGGMGVAIGSLLGHQLAEMMVH